MNKRVIFVVTDENMSVFLSFSSWCMLHVSFGIIFHSNTADNKNKPHSRVSGPKRVHLGCWSAAHRREGL